MIFGWIWLFLLFIPVASAEGQPITLGLITPLTGSRASIGEDARKGAELAIDRLRKEDIGEIGLDLEDSQGDPKTGVSAFQKQLSQGVRFFITQNSNVSLAIQPLIARHNVLQMAITTTSDRYSTPNDLTFRTNGTTQGEARTMLEFLKTISGRIMLLTMQDEYPVDLRKHLLSLGL